MELPLQKIAYIVVKAREFDAEVPPEGMKAGSNSSDDGEVSILEDTPDNPTEEELRAALQNLNIDELTELLALVWLGRGDTATNWPQALGMAREMASERTIDYLMETPLLGDLIEEGLGQLDLSLLEYQQGHL